MNLERVSIIKLTKPNGRVFYFTPEELPPKYSNLPITNCIPEINQLEQTLAFTTQLNNDLQDKITRLKSTINQFFSVISRILDGFSRSRYDDYNNLSKIVSEMQSLRSHDMQITSDLKTELTNVHEIIEKL